MSKTHEQIINDFINSGFEGKDCRSVLRAIICCCMPQSDADKLAQKLCANDRSLANIVDMPKHQLIEKFGLDEPTALLIKCIPDLLCAYQRQSCRQFIFNVGEACEYFAQMLASSRVEKLVACFLDNDLHIVNCEVINVGGKESVGVMPLKIIRAADMPQSKFAFIAHNHPLSGAAPSDEDVSVTNSIKQILSHIGIRLLDHIIVSGSGETFSMKRAGRIPLSETIN